MTSIKRLHTLIQCNPELVFIRKTTEFENESSVIPPTFLFVVNGCSTYYSWRGGSEEE